MLKISVVTVSYNQGRYIKQNIESVLNQDYPNFEHIIIDACSTDNTLDILKSYPHLNWTSEPDKGQSDGLNKGFKKATGDIIFWVNSDDMVAPGAFKAVNQFFEQNPDKSVLVGNQILIDENGGTIRVEPAKPFTLNYLLNSADVYILQNATVFRKSVLDNVGLLDLSYHYTMDLELFIRIAKEYECYAMPADIGIFRLWEESKTSNYRLRFFKDTYRCRRKHNARLLSGGNIWIAWNYFKEPFIRTKWLRNIVHGIKTRRAMKHLQQ